MIPDPELVELRDALFTMGSNFDIMLNAMIIVLRKRDLLTDDEFAAAMKTAEQNIKEAITQKQHEAQIGGY